MLTVLIRNGGWVRGMELRQQMRDDHGLEVADHPGATNGLIAGFTRRYSKSFRRDLLDIQWADEKKNHAKIRIGDRADVYDRYPGDDRLHRLFACDRSFLAGPGITCLLACQSPVDPARSDRRRVFRLFLADRLVSLRPREHTAVYPPVRERCYRPDQRIVSVHRVGGHRVLDAQRDRPVEQGRDRPVGHPPGCRLCVPSRCSYRGVSIVGLDVHGRDHHWNPR